MITFAVLGLGNRGSVYSDNIVKHNNAKIVSVCDVSPASLNRARELYGVKDEDLFDNEEKFFEKKACRRSDCRYFRRASLPSDGKSAFSRV